MTLDFDELFEPNQPAEPQRVNGRYKLPDPLTGKLKTWSSVSSTGKALMDDYALHAWEIRMILKGLRDNPGLLNALDDKDTKADARVFNAIAQRAKDEAGGNEASRRGTAIHTEAESLDLGETTLSQVSSEYLPTISAYVDCMEYDNLRAVPHLIERTIVCPEMGAAGRFDRVLQEANGTYVIGDIKSGHSLEYGWVEIAVQLALYAHGINQHGIWDKYNQQWSKTGIPTVRTDYAVVMHLPVDTSECTLYAVDIDQGWSLARLCMDVKAARRSKGLALPYLRPGASEDEWGARFRGAQSRQEVSRLFSQASRELSGDPRFLQKLMFLGLEAVGEL